MSRGGREHSRELDELELSSTSGAPHGFVQERIGFSGKKEEMGVHRASRVNLSATVQWSVDRSSGVYHPTDIHPPHSLGYGDDDVVGSGGTEGREVRPDEDFVEMSRNTPTLSTAAARFDPGIDCGRKAWSARIALTASLSV